MQQNSDIIGLAGLRLDGRRSDDLRRFQYNLGLVENADGSAYIEQGLNKLLVSVHGPQEPVRKSGSDASHERGTIVCRLLNAPFSGTDRRKRRFGQPDRRVSELETIVREAMESVVLLDLYSRSEITVVVHVLENDGSIVCAIINATTMALMDAGIAMQDMVIACSVGVLKQKFCRDVTLVEQNSGAYLPIAIRASTEDVVYMQLDSRLSVDNIDEALKAAIEGCRTIRKLIEKGIKDDILRR